MKTLITTVAALVLVTGCSGTQPSPPCLAAHGSYAVAYTLKSGAAAGTCALTNGIVGVQKYNQVDGGMPTLAMRPIEIGFSDSAKTGIAIGTFKAAFPDSNSLCQVETFDNDAVSNTLTYKFSNVKLYVTAKAPGTQMTFDVQVTDSDATTPCNATYSARAVWPVVGCAYMDTIDPATETITDPIYRTPTPPDDKYCATVDSAVTGGNWGWSYLALNPDFDVQCATDPNDWQGKWNTKFWASATGGWPDWDVQIGAFCVPRGNIPSFCPPEGCSWRPKEQ